MFALFASCSSDDSTSSPSVTIHTYKVAVIMGGGKRVHWERTAKWAQENIAEAQRGMNERVELQLTFKSQDDADILQYMQQVAEDTTVVAIIGPTTSAYAERRPVMLLCADEDDGEDYKSSASHNAYAEWFGFIAEEYGLTVDGVYLYKDEGDVRRYVSQMCGTDWHLENKALLFNPSSPRMVLAFDDEAGRIKSAVPAGKYFYTPQVYCSDAFVSEQTASAATNVTYEGVDLYALPESGFNRAYRQRFGEDLINGEAQFYDGLCLVAYAAVLQQHTGQTLNDALLSVVDGRDGRGGSWLPADMSRNFEQLAQGRTPDIDGVSSSWTFDEKTHTSVCGSTFRRWRLYEGQFLTTEYVSTEGSRRSSSAKAVWDWTATHMQTFSADDGSPVVYPALDDRWALLVAGSKGWANYRFQSDVFAMYQLLRQHGYQDDHIVLICEDDVARHPNNPHQGELRTSDTGANVYDRAAIDYRLNDLTPADIGAILQGRASDRLPKVLSPDADDNVLVF